MAAATNTVDRDGGADDGDQRHSRNRQRYEAHDSNVDSRFCCNICLEPVTDPVATRCGHLYCWPCLYRWLEPGMLPGEKASLGLPPSTSLAAVNNGRRICPVCKSKCSLSSLVPIYVRSDDAAEGRTATQESRSTDGAIENDNDYPASVEASIGHNELRQSADEDSDGELSILAEERDGETNSATSLVEGARSERTSATATHQDSPVPLQVGSTNDSGSSRVSTVPSNNGDARSDAIQSTGLRQRRVRSDAQGRTIGIPTRPAARIQHSEHDDDNDDERNRNGTASNNHHDDSNRTGGARMAPAPSNASLSEGILLSFQRVTGAILGDSPIAINGSQQINAVVPPLHRHHRRQQQQMQLSASDGGSPAHWQYNHAADDVDPTATEYLSRVLFVLASFLILCLLIL